MVRENRRLAIKGNLEVAAFAGRERRPLLAQPPPEFTVLHKNPLDYATNLLCQQEEK